MAETLLTSEEFIKGLTPVSDNLQSKYLISAIREAQEETLRLVLGDALTDKLKRLVGDGTIRAVGNEAYKACLDKAQYLLAYQAVANCVMKTAYKIGNIGVVRASDENLSPASFTEVNALRDNYQHRADAYMADLQRWLLRNKASLPELTECHCNEIRAHLKSSASCGLVLGGRRGKIYTPCGRRYLLR